VLRHKIKEKIGVLAKEAHFAVVEPFDRE